MNKDQIYTEYFTKAEMVVNSCKTIEHVKSARKYVSYLCIFMLDLFQYGDDSRKDVNFKINLLEYRLKNIKNSIKIN